MFTVNQSACPAGRQSGLGHTSSVMKMASGMGCALSSHAHVIVVGDLTAKDGREQGAVDKEL